MFAHARPLALNKLGKANRALPAAAVQVHPFRKGQHIRCYGGGSSQLTKGGRPGESVMPREFGKQPTLIVLAPVCFCVNNVPSQTTGLMLFLVRRRSDGTHLRRSCLATAWSLRTAISAAFVEPG